MHWFKFYGQDFMTDPKIRRLNPIQQLMWVYLLCLASNTEDGEVKFITEEDLTLATGILPQDDMWDMTSGFFKRCVEMDMLRVTNNGVALLNYTKRQISNASNAERQARFRKKHRYNKDNGNVTQRYENNARVEESRIDTIVAETTSDTSYESTDEELTPKQINKRNARQHGVIPQEQIDQCIEIFINHLKGPNYMLEDPAIPSKAKANAMLSPFLQKHTIKDFADLTEYVLFSPNSKYLKGQLTPTLGAMLTETSINFWQTNK